MRRLTAPLFLCMMMPGFAATPLTVYAHLRAALMAVSTASPPESPRQMLISRVGPQEKPSGSARMSGRE